jgi:hypothetical protein
MFLFVLRGTPIALDFAGSAYVTGRLGSANLLTKSFGPAGADQAMLFKLAPDGSHEVYETALGGSVRSEGMAVAVDSGGSAYIVGITTSIDFPLVHPFQSSLGARPLWISGDSGATFSPIDALPFAYLQALVFDPTRPLNLYAATQERGIYRSADGGKTWQQATNGISNTDLALAPDGKSVLAIDPQHPSTLFAGLGVQGKGAVYRTADGGNTWVQVDQGSGVVQQVAVDPQNPNNVYTVWANVTSKSSDGGSTWTNLVFPGTSIATLALDPHVSGTIFAISTEILNPHAALLPPMCGKALMEDQRGLS